MSWVIEKAAFFEKWYSEYPNLGNNYGRHFARSEDSQIVKEIIKHCKKTDKTSFEATLELFDKHLGNVIIIAINSALNSFLRNTGNFKSRWEISVPKLEVRGFEGWYNFREIDIPVFEVYCHDREKKILIIDKSRLGRLIQYPPDRERDKEELTGIFYINFQSFSENNGLMSTFLQNPPDWLASLGDQVNQRDHLEEKVLIKIFEGFEFKKHQEFEGYLINLLNEKYLP
jgi:hypothetical protein